jgi:hypothetical protein
MALILEEETQATTPGANSLCVFRVRTLFWPRSAFLAILPPDDPGKAPFLTGDACGLLAGTRSAASG